MKASTVRLTSPAGRHIRPREGRQHWCRGLVLTLGIDSGLGDVLILLVATALLAGTVSIWVNRARGHVLLNALLLCFALGRSVDRGRVQFIRGPCRGQ